MAEYRVSHRYAKSLIELAHQEGQLDNVHSDILMFIETLNSNRELKLLLKNPVVKHLHKKNILEKLFKSRVTEITMAFFDIICRKNREALLHSIAIEFVIEYREFKGIQTAKLVTATAINDKLKKQFEQIVLDISGMNSVELEEVIEPNVIGGFILTVGDQQIDDSVSGKLNKIRKQLVV